MVNSGCLRRQDLDRVIVNVLRGMQATPAPLVYCEDLGICGTIAREVARECHQLGLPYARRVIDARVFDVVFGVVDAEPLESWMSH